MTKRKLNEKVNKAHSGALPGVVKLNTDQGMGHYEWGKKVAGHDGKKQTSPIPGMGAFKDQPIAVGYTKAETKMAKAAMGGRTTKMTSAGSKESSDTNTKSPVRKVTESDIRAELAQYRSSVEEGMVGNALRWAGKKAGQVAGNAADAVGAEMGKAASWAGQQVKKGAQALGNKAMNKMGYQGQAFGKAPPPPGMEYVIGADGKEKLAPKIKGDVLPQATREARNAAKKGVMEADQVDPNAPQDPNNQGQDPNADPNAQPAPAEQPPEQVTGQATADTVLDQLPELVAHAKERKVLDPSYNKKALTTDIADTLGVETTDPLVAKVVRFISTTEKISESFKSQVRGDEEAKPLGRVLGDKPKKHPFNDRLVGEDEELPVGEDTVTLDVPLLIRVMEYAKEDAKTDMELHSAVERMLSIGGTLTMDDYHSIVSNLDEEAMVEHIVKVKGGYELKSKKTGKNLGKYPTRAGAEKRERQVQYFKHAGESVEEGSDKLQGTPVVSLKDFGDEDNTKDKYGRTVPKKLKKDDPRVKFHKEPKQQGVAEGQLGKAEQIFYAKNPDGTKTYARVQDSAQLAQLQQKYSDSEVKMLPFGTPEVDQWLKSRGVSLRSFLPGMVVTKGVEEATGAFRNPAVNSGPTVYLHKSFSSNIAQAKEVLEKYHSVDGATLKVSPPSGKYGRDYVEIHLPAKPYNTVDDVKRTLKSAGVDFAGVKESGMAESAFKDKEDLDAKRKALQDIQMDPHTHKDPELKAELMRRKAELEKEAKDRGFVKESFESIRSEFYRKKKGVL